MIAASEEWREPLGVAPWELQLGHAEVDEDIVMAFGQLMAVKVELRPAVRPAVVFEAEKKREMEGEGVDNENAANARTPANPLAAAALSGAGESCLCSSSWSLLCSCCCCSCSYMAPSSVAAEEVTLPW